MLLPQIPTDNLYKFIFIAGLSIIGASSLLYNNKHTILTNKLDSLELNIINAEIKFMTDSISMDFELLKIEASKRQDSIKTKKLENLVESKKRVEPTELIELQESLIQAENYIWLARKKLIEEKMARLAEKKRIDYQFKKINENSNYLLILSIFCSISFTIGLWLTKYGYKMWNENIQKPIDERTRIELGNLKSSGT